MQPVFFHLRDMDKTKGREVSNIVIGASTAAMNDLDVEKRARLLCQDLVDGVAKSNLCSLTTAIYDTAWL